MNKDTKVQLITKSLLHLSILTKENTLEEALEYLNKTDENNINNKRKYASILDTTEEGIEWLVRNFYTIFKKKDVDAIYSFYKDEFNKANMDDKLEFFKQYLTPSKDEVQLFGEVFTPISLIEKLLDELPKEVWSNSKLKWLDPANGIGNFPIVIYQRLMKGLKSVIEDEEKRRKHILEEMLYMVDISVKNTFICMNIFDPEGKYKLNICRGDFLNSNLNEVFGVEKFDIIVGNPPYNPPATKQGKRIGSGNKIWHKFIEKAFLILNDTNGYLCFITPYHWRMFKSKNGVHKKAQQLIWSNNILSIFPANKYFNAAGNLVIDAWVVTTNNSVVGINMPDIFKKLNLYIYNCDNQMLNYITDYCNISTTDCYNITIKSNDSRKFNCIRNSVIGDDIRKYKHLNTMAQYKKGNFDWYDTKTHGFNDTKLIISGSGSLNSFVYDDGKMGCGHNAHAYIVKNEHEANKIVNFLQNSKTIRNLIKETSTGFATNLKFIFKIPKKWVDNFMIYEQQ